MVVTAKELHGFAQLYLFLDGRVDVGNGDLTTAQLLAVSTYARRVETEVGRQMNPCPFPELTKQEILMGMKTTHDRFEEREVRRLTKLDGVE